MRRRARELNSGALSSFVRSAPFMMRHAPALLITCLAIFGCHPKSIPEGKSAIDGVRVSGAPEDVEESLTAGLATKKSPTLLGIPGVYDYATYDEAALQKDIERVERQLRRRGYYEARVSAARVIRTKENRVRVELNIDAGDPVKIRSLETKGLAALPFEAAEAATNEMRLRVDSVFDEDEFEAAKQDIANALADRGYAFAKVTGSAKVDLAAKSAQVELLASPGRRATLGEIRIEGLEEIKDAPVRRALKLVPGERYSRKELRAARSALFSLNVFSRVEVIPLLEDEDSDVVPITIKVRESTLRDLTAGVGGRLDLLSLAVTANVGWTHSNFLGGLRKFSVETKPGLTLYPTSLEYFKAPSAVFPHNVAVARLEQPGFIEGRTRGYTQGQFNVYPLLYSVPDNTDPRDERVIGYREVATALGASRNFGGRLLLADLSLNWQSNDPFYYQNPGDEEVAGLERVIIAYPELFTQIDLRDDPLQPTKGFYVQNSLQTALPVLGGEVYDIRLRPEAGAFVPLDKKHKVILATRFGVGLLFPANYGETLYTPLTGALDYTNENVVADQHKLIFRAFYSGGPNSNRGYPYQRIGPQGPIGFLLPRGEECDDPNGNNPSTCERALGGFSLWEASLELRWRTFSSLGFVLFADASDVSTQVANFSFGEPHLSIGPGLRYHSPVGPIRLDLGWRVPGLQVVDDNEEEPPDISEIEPYVSQTWIQSFALQLLIGEAF